jgi:hypothetical protein
MILRTDGSEPPIQVPQKQLAFHPLARRNALRRRDARQQSRLQQLRGPWSVYCRVESDLCRKIILPLLEKLQIPFCNFSLILFASALLTSIDLPSAAVAAINFPSVK